MALEIEFNGTQLGGAQGVSRCFREEKFTVTTGADGMQVRTRNRDVGHAVIRFAADSEGDRYLRSLEEGASGQLRISGDPGGPDFTSDAWINHDRSQGNAWRFEIVKLPR